MPYRSFREVVRKSTYIPQLILTVAINFGINFGLGWAFYSNWGQHGHAYHTWPSVYVWEIAPEINSSIALDFSLTILFMAFFCTLLGTGGAVKDVKEKKCDTMDPCVVTGEPSSSDLPVATIATNPMSDAAFAPPAGDRTAQWGTSAPRGKGTFWRTSDGRRRPLIYYTPVHIRNLWLRSLAQAVYWWVLIWFVMVLIFSLALRGNSMAGLDYVIFKGIWAAVIAVPIYTVVYLAALDSRNYPELEFENLMKHGGMAIGSGAGEAPPLVANIGHV